MSVYFKYFPKGTHTNKLGTDITRRFDFYRTVLRDKYVFLPYTIDGDDRPEDVAYFYYESVDHTWVVYLSNDILDPYYDWPLPYDKFNAFIKKKYEALSGTTGDAVLAWTQNTQITDNIAFYRNIEDPDIKINVDTYNLDSDLVQGDWEAVRYFQYETELNDDKRVIELLDKRYLPQALREIEDILNDGII